MTVCVCQCVPEMAASSLACLCWHLHVKSCTGHAVVVDDCWESVDLFKGFPYLTFLSVE